MKLYYLAVGARPRQWIKNTFVFAAAIFSGRFREPDVLVASVLAFFAISAIASGIYLVNDILDREQDRLHPVKRNRPLAAGRISAADCIAGAVVLWILAAILLALLGQPGAVAVAVVYFILNLLYVFWFKQKVVLDVLFIALGFVLRVILGGEATGIEISQWLILCTFLLALFLGFSKRRHELVLLDSEASNHRQNLSEYDPYLLDQMIAVTTASTLLSYCLYTILGAPARFERMEYTIPFVAYGIFRYLYLVHRRDQGGDPAEVVLRDRGLLVNLVLWTGLVLWLSLS